VSTQPYHHGNLRAALVETAVELARTTGPDGVVLREVARRAGVSHSAAYRHFSDRAALLSEVAAAGMTGLEQAMRTRMDEIEESDPMARSVARLRATGRGYVDFAVREPGLFAGAFAAPLQEGVDCGDPYGLLNEVLDELVSTGAMTADRREGADVACWSLVHGYADLHVHGPLRDLPAAERDHALELVLDLAEAGLTRP
jgi:AcrR family transcriptional regulator